MAIQVGADPLLLCNNIHSGKGGGLLINNGKGRLVGNSVGGHKKACCVIQNGSEFSLTANRIHDGLSVGVSVLGFSTGRIEKTDIWGHALNGLELSEGASAEVIGNLIRDNRKAGILIDGPSRGVVTIASNDVSGNLIANLALTRGSDPIVEHNLIHNAAPLLDRSAAGVFISGLGTRGRFQGNDIHGDKSACILLTAGADPIVTSNAIHEAGEAGVVVRGVGALGRLECNSVWGNGKTGVEVSKGGRPTLIGNIICGNAGAGILFDTSCADEALMGADNVLGKNALGDVIVMAGDAPPIKRDSGFYDRASCAGCGAAGAALEQCSGCARFGAPSSPRYCGPACQKAHMKTHQPDCQRAEELAVEWLHAMDALLDLPGCPFGDLEPLARRRRQREPGMAAGG